ncbi:MAG: type I restriction enzyme HsdR N-terminal domain-containing protein [Ferruginibacter sp.]
MIDIVYPAVKPAIKTEGEKEFIFCVVRKKWMLITPEEWVRQNILLYLIHSLQYPASLIAVEKQLALGELKKRFDIVVYKSEKPFLLIECKAMEVPVTQKTLDQAMRYNINLQAGYFIISNGNHTYGFGVDNGRLQMLQAFPAYF